MTLSIAKAPALRYNHRENDITIRKAIKIINKTLTVSFTGIGTSFMKLISSCMKLVS